MRRLVAIFETMYKYFLFIKLQSISSLVKKEKKKVMDEREKGMMIMKIALIIITTKKNILDY